MKFRRLFFVANKFTTALVLASLLFDSLALLPWSKINFAEAAEVNIDSSVSTDAPSHTVSGSQTVFISDQVGYRFYRDSDGICKYIKTTNGGNTWAGTTTFDNQNDCIGISVWYDRWTPGDTGNYIHLATIDTSLDDVFYNRLDTVGDTLLAVTSLVISTTSTAVYTSAANKVSITKATDGKLYVVSDDDTGTGTELIQCSTGCDLIANWSDAGIPPQGNALSYSMLLPLDSGKVMLINRSTGNILRSSTWNGSIWSGFSTIDASAIRNTTYDVGMAATVGTTTGDIFLAYVADNDTFTVADHDIRTAHYSAGSWTSKTNLLTNTSRGLLQTAIAIDQNDGGLYIAYTGRTTINTPSTANVYWASSSNNMTSWSTEQGPVGTTTDDIYGIDLNLMSKHRIYTTWVGITPDDLFGDTIANIEPPVVLTSTSTQTSQVRNNTSDFNLGATFVLTSNATRTVSNITLSENGTINAQDDLKNIKLYFDLDTSAPYDCASESYTVGVDDQFGSTVTTGFSGSDGTAGFTESPVTISPQQTMCLYTIVDVQVTASDLNTIQVYVNNPEDDVLVSGGVVTYPDEAVELSGTTTVVSSNPVQTGYHWRQDNGTEVTASSATNGVENTALTALQISQPRRLRIAVANDGSTSSVSTNFRLEYGNPTPTCGDIASWTVVGTSGAHWIPSDSANLTNGSNSINITGAGFGAVTDPKVTFFSANGGLLDTSVETATMTLPINNFFEAEYSIVASTSASQGETYCFRLSRAGTALPSYTHYPQATINSDVVVRAFSSQRASTTVGSTTVHIGGGFSVIENNSSRNVTSIKITETGSVDADEGLSNLVLRYDLDTSDPYDCASESFGGSEPQYGATSSTGFSDSGETAIFTGSLGITTTSTMCIYPVFDVTNSALNNQTIDIKIDNPSTEVVVSGGGSVGPSTPLEIASSTTIQGGIFTQLHYHWRTDNGTETTASSATSGTENTAETDFGINSVIRLRLAVGNTGLVTTIPTRFRIEYAPKVTTCAAASVWTDVNASSDGWDMYDSSNLTHGGNTTNIAVASGGVSNGAGSFISSNGGIADTASLSATNTIPINDYLDLEYSITSTSFTSYDTTYCFRASANGTAFGSYNNYAEISTAPKRDFKIQRGSTQVSGTGTTVVAGVDYTAPATTSKAFVMITNTMQTGAGDDSLGGAQNTDDVTAYISNPGNLLTNFIISRPAAAISNTRVDWEIIEFIGATGTDNEIVVRDVGILNFSTSALAATGTAVSGIINDSDVVVFISGARNSNASRNFYASAITSSWNNATDQPVFTRAANGASQADVSYAVVEFVGQNWNIQRIQHSYAAAGVTETESITAVNSLAHTFMHVQKRVGATTNVVHLGHEVWLSSIGAISFRLETGASVAVEQTTVAWVIENTQSGNGEMNVIRSDGSTTGGAEPLALSVNLSSSFEAMNNTSISGNGRAAGADTNHPRAHAGLTLTSTSTYQVWRSDTGTLLTFRAEIIEWPVADLAIRQNYYRFYVDNNQLTPDDPWPVGGGSDLGENTSITVSDEPLATGERVRVRMTLSISNASMPAGLLNFKLQYGLRSSSCSAISSGSWIDLGATSSSAIWRGYAATGTTDGASLSGDPPTGGDLLISVADRAGSLVESNPSAVNPYSIVENENVEYDWFVEQNGALPISTYCFRAVRSDGTDLEGYNNYPQIRTAGFTPTTRNWRWYDGVSTETPTTSLAIENVAPIDIANDDNLTLRISVYEKRNVQGNDIKYKLQFSEYSDFSIVTDVAATSTCGERSYWCYTAGPVPDNTKISTTTLSDANISCVGGVGDGCGTHNSSPASSTGQIHYGGKTQEYAFYLTHAGARVNAVYYFRLYNVADSAAVTTYDGSETYPSLVTEGPTLEFTVGGLPSATTTAGITTDATTTPTAIGFGSLGFGGLYEAAQRLTVSTNATEGYQLLKYSRQALLSAKGVSIPVVSGTNASPLTWAAGCNASSTGCVGYHASDPTLNNGSTRFALDDTFAALATTSAEIMYSSVPTIDTHDIVYRLKVTELQASGDYETDIVYVAVPSF